MIIGKLTYTIYRNKCYRNNLAKKWSSAFEWLTLTWQQISSIKLLIEKFYKKSKVMRSQLDWLSCNGRKSY
jgi:hypothetical protein